MRRVLLGRECQGGGGGGGERSSREVGYAEKREGGCSGREMEVTHHPTHTCRYPKPIDHRIPNFIGSDEAAARLAAQDFFISAEVYVHLRLKGCMRP